MPRSAIRTKLKEILPTSMFADVMELAAAEPEYFGEDIERQPASTPEELVANYGLIDDLKECEDSVHHVPVTMTDPVDIINHALEHRACWGEFLGGVVGSLTNFDAATRERILPTLSRMVKHAIERGVDH